MALDPRRAAEELARREQALARAANVTSAIRAELFDRQINFVEDPSRNKAAICTRRAGKTMMWPRYCFIVALEKPKSLIRVWGITRLRTKQLMWQEFLDVAARHRIKVKAHETELTIRLDNGSEIRFVGADKDQQAQRKRGDKTTLEVILESQLFGPFLRTLVEDVVEPCLFDTQGTICMEGTPGPIPAGYWHAITGGPDISGKWEGEGAKVATGRRNEMGEPETELIGAGWSCHRWSLLDNPFLPHAAEEMARLRKKRSWTADSPTYMREYLGRWVKDDSALFYAFDEQRNTYDVSTLQPWGPGWSHCLGLDIGWKDATAITVWGWHENDPNLYEAFSWSQSGVLAGEVMERIEGLKTRGFNIIKQVADVGGGGRLYVEDMQARFGISFEAAEKTKKYDHVLIYNDQLRSGMIKIQEGSALALELSALLKDPAWEPESGKPPNEDPRCANHVADSSLYSLRACFNYAFETVKAAPVFGTPEYEDAVESADEIALSAPQGQGLEWWDQEDAEEM